MTATTLPDVMYKGHQPSTGGAAVIHVLNAEGQHVGVVHHVVRHSPTGMSWGYGGSGPADCARSLLLAALGDQAACLDCGGTGRVVLTETGDQLRLPARNEPQPHPELVTSCWRCGGEGYREVPYQEFKFEFVARWGSEWRIPRSAILAWLMANGVEVS